MTPFTKWFMYACGAIIIINLVSDTLVTHWGIRLGFIAMVAYIAGRMAAAEEREQDGSNQSS